MLNALRPWCTYWNAHIPAPYITAPQNTMYFLCNTIDDNIAALRNYQLSDPRILVSYPTALSCPLSNPKPLSKQPDSLPRCSSLINPSIQLSSASTVTVLFIDILKSFDLKRMCSYMLQSLPYTSGSILFYLVDRPCAANTRSSKALLLQS